MINLGFSIFSYKYEKDIDVYLEFGQFKRKPSFKRYGKWDRQINFSILRIDIHI